MDEDPGKNERLRVE